MAHYSKINKVDIANGPGVRVSVFLSGCTHHCKGCFNQETWDFNYGEEFTNKTIVDIIDNSRPDYISGITLLGGDPLCGQDNQAASHALCHMFKEIFPDKTIWLYTGSLFEEIKDLPVMDHVDVCVDGPFVEDLKDIRLVFRGSSNQRIIDVKRSKKEDKIITINY